MSRRRLYGHVVLVNRITGEIWGGKTLCGKPRAQTLDKRPLITCPKCLSLAAQPEVSSLVVQSYRRYDLPRWDAR